MNGFTLETEPEVVREAFRPLLVPVYGALELAVPKATTIVAENGWDNTPHLTSHIARAEVKRILASSSTAFEFEETPENIAMENLAMEGLSIKFKGVTVKVLKGKEIPKPTTEPRRAFYQQALSGLWVAGQVPPIKSLVVLWDCDPTGANLALNLCCTKDRTGRDHWMIAVPHPAEWMIVPPSPSEVVDDFEEFFGDDKEDEASNQKG